MNPLDNIKEMAFSFERRMLGVKPPAWLLDEGQQKIVLILNHVLKQEPVASERLKRQKGKTVELRWNDIEFRIAFTPAGLVERVLPLAEMADLVLHIHENSPLIIMQHLMQGTKPPIRIEGDVQLAAEVNWLIDHVRWDFESDLARICGDEAARLTVQIATQCAYALREFVRTVQQGLQVVKTGKQHSNG